MDQSRAAFRRVDGAAGLEGRVLRPLSARLLEATRPEADGRVLRAELGRLHGRTRRAQIDLAAAWGLGGWPTPSGGCCKLADVCFARRLRDRLAHAETLAPGDAELLSRGRHFRLAWDLKLVVGRDAEENAWLAARQGRAWSCQVADGRGALVLVEGEPGERWEAVAALAARYSAVRDARRVAVRATRGSERLELDVVPFPAARLESLRV
jgi:hypothetical protein